MFACEYVGKSAVFVGFDDYATLRHLALRMDLQPWETRQLLWEQRWMTTSELDFNMMDSWRRLLKAEKPSIQPKKIASAGDNLLSLTGIARSFIQPYEGWCWWFNENYFRYKEYTRFPKISEISGFRATDTRAGPDFKLPDANDPWMGQYADGGEDTYWALTKEAIYALWEPDLLKGPTYTPNRVQRFILSGYGAGGYRASLAAQWLRRRMGMKLSRTYTFNAPGTICKSDFAQHPYLAPGPNHGAGNKWGIWGDVGRSSVMNGYHDNIWNYKHVWSLHGLIDHHVGRTGTILGDMTDRNSPARVACEKTAKFTGADLLIDIPPETYVINEAGKKARDLWKHGCEYYVQNVFYFFDLMQQAGSLLPDGGTDADPYMGDTEGGRNVAKEQFLARMDAQGDRQFYGGPIGLHGNTICVAAYQRTWDINWEDCIPHPLYYTS